MPVLRQVASIWIIQSREPAGTVHAVIFCAQHEFRRDIPAQTNSYILGEAVWAGRPVAAAYFFPLRSSLSVNRTS